MHKTYVNEHDANTECQSSIALHHSTGRQSQDEQLSFVHSRLTVEELKNIQAVASCVANALIPLS